MEDRRALVPILREEAMSNRNETKWGMRMEDDGHKAWGKRRERKEVREKRSSGIFFFSHLAVLPVRSALFGTAWFW